MSIKQDLIDSERQAAQERARMGAKAYDEWVKTQETQYYTLFKSESEVKEYMQKAGYDYKIIRTSKYLYIKTHIGSDDYDCIWWLYRGNEIFAVINNYVDKSYVNNYMEKVKKAFGKQAFFLSEKERANYKNSLSKYADDSVIKSRQSITTVVKPQATVKKEPEVVEVEEVVEPIPEYTFPTIYTDTNILKQAIKNAGINPKIQGNIFQFTIDGFETSIYQDGENNYEFKVIGKCDLKKVHNCFNKIETEYNKIVQNNILENIKNKVTKSSTMRLEQEEVLDDNSVLLTISI